MDLRERLILMRIRKDMTVKALADYIGVSDRHLASFEKDLLNLSSKAVFVGHILAALYNYEKTDKLVYRDTGERLLATIRKLNTSIKKVSKLVEISEFKLQKFCKGKQLTEEETRRIATWIAMQR